MQTNFVPVTANPQLKELGIHRDTYDYDFVQISKDLNKYIGKGQNDAVLELIRAIAPNDLFFLMYFVLDLPVNDPFVIARIYECQQKHDMTIDLWARGFWKSMTLTYGLPVQELINNRERRICIFSFTRAAAKKQMRPIKSALESNDWLKRAFPDVFWENPKRDAFKWAEDAGLYVKRNGNFREASVEAHGLDNLPVGSHFTDLIYDDVIEMGTTNTPDMIKKSYKRFMMSLHLVHRKHSKRIIGTRYSHKDPYAEIMKNTNWEVRLYPSEVGDNGEAKMYGIPVYKTREELDEIYAGMDDWTYSSQMLQNPIAGKRQDFNTAWLRYWHPEKDRKPQVYLNYYLTVDPASTKKRSSDYTVMMVLGADPLRNIWLVDMVRDKLTLGEKWDKLVGLVQKYSIHDVGYESYSMQADTQYLNEKMEQTGIYFTLIELGGKMAKPERIRQLVPWFKSGRVIIPKGLPYQDVEGEWHELTSDFIEEYSYYPYKNDDMLDAMARLFDSKMNLIFPTNKPVDLKQGIKRSNPFEKSHKKHGSWMSR